MWMEMLWGANQKDKPWLPTMRRDGNIPTPCVLPASCVAGWLLFLPIWALVLRGLSQMGLATLRDVRQKVLGGPWPPRPRTLTFSETLFPSLRLTHWSKVKPTHPARQAGPRQHRGPGFPHSTDFRRKAFL